MATREVKSDELGLESEKGLQCSKVPGDKGVLAAGALHLPINLVYAFGITEDAQEVQLLRPANCNVT